MLPNSIASSSKVSGIGQTIELVRKIESMLREQCIVMPRSVRYADLHLGRLITSLHLDHKGQGKESIYI